MRPAICSEKIRPSRDDSLSRSTFTKVATSTGWLGSSGALSNKASVARSLNSIRSARDIPPALLP